MTSEQPSRHRVHGTKPELIATLARHHEHSHVSCRPVRGGGARGAADHALLGLISIERMLAAEEDARVADVMESAPPIVGPEADQEAVALESTQSSFNSPWSSA